jgi:hypothetical protein
MIEATMKQFIVVKYLHTTGMPAAGGSHDQINDAKTEALQLSKDHPEDPVMVETRATFEAFFYKGAEKYPYLRGK